MPIEPLVPGSPAVLSASILSLSVLDPDVGTPNTIIETTDPWAIQVSWDIAGLIAGALGGEWTVRAFLETLEGGPFSGQVGPTEFIPLISQPPTSPRHYSATIHVPAGTPPAGLYKLTVAITYDVVFGGVHFPQEMAGFVDGPMLQFYVP